MFALRLTLSLLSVLVFTGSVSARDVADPSGETCALFTAVLEWRGPLRHEIFVNDRLFHQTRTNFVDRVLGNYIRKRRRERRPVFHLPESRKIVGEALSKTWAAFDVAALNGADQPMVCAPEDFAPISVAVFSSTSGIARRAGGEQESYSDQPDLFLRDVFIPSRRLGHQWAFSRPGISAGGLESVVFASHSCGGLCGDGSYYLLRREEREAPWLVVGTAVDWVS